MSHRSDVPAVSALLTPPGETVGTPGSAETLLPQVALRPVREGQAFEATVEQLATAIRIGALPVGSGLPPERELAGLLGVSRITLREAMEVLRDLGMIETRRGRGGGSFVTLNWTDRATPDDALPRGAALEDVLSFRRVVEGGAAYLAASRDLSTGDVGYLNTCLAEVTRAAGRDAVTHRQADSRLHLAVAAVSGSPTLVEAVTRSRGQVHDLLSVIPVLTRNLEHSNADHVALVTAVLANEPDAARAIAEEHCDKTAALLRGLVG